MKKPAITDRLLVRHWLTHPEESAYEAAKHMNLSKRTVQFAAKRIKARTGIQRERLLEFLCENPIAHKNIGFYHPNPNVWLRHPPVPVSLSGEDAAAVMGWDIVPNRHIFYIEATEVNTIVKSLLGSGGRLAEDMDQNISLRLRDKWMIDEPVPLVERGQRLVDYKESKNIQLLAGLEEGRWD